MLSYFREVACKVPDIYTKGVDDQLFDSHLSWDDRRKIFSWAGKGSGFMTFHGETGRCKTGFGYAVLQQILKHNEKKRSEGHTIDFQFFALSMPDLYKYWLSSFKESAAMSILANHLSSCHFLFIDDIGMREASDGFLDFFIGIVNQRSMMSQHCTLFTTNCSSEELQKLYSERFSSRVSKGRNFIKFTGKDERNKSE